VCERTIAQAELAAFYGMNVSEDEARLTLADYFDAHLNAPLTRTQALQRRLAKWWTTVKGS